jgi:hypothetical protein
MSKTLAERIHRLFSSIEVVALPHGKSEAGGQEGMKNMHTAKDAAK